LPTGNHRYVVINSPAARLYMYENGEVVDSMRVVAGKPDPKAVEWKLDAAVDQTIADLKGKPAEAFQHPRVTIAKDATVAHLAKLLGALAFREASAASLTNAKK
jgi:hypothetical protein